LNWLLEYHWKEVWSQMPTEGCFYSGSVTI